MLVGFQGIFAADEFPFYEFADHVHLWVIVQPHLMTLGNEEEGDSEVLGQQDSAFGDGSGKMYRQFKVVAGYAPHQFYRLPEDV